MTEIKELIEKYKIDKNREVMNYRHQYFKLQSKIYTTIRKSKKQFKKGQVIIACFRNIQQHVAKINYIQEVKLAQIHTGFLLLDCLYPNSKIITRYDCYELFQSFYENPIDFQNQKFHLFLMERLKCDKN